MKRRASPRPRRRHYRGIVPVIEETLAANPNIMRFVRRRLRECAVPSVRAGRATLPSGGRCPSSARSRRPRSRHATSARSPARPRSRCARSRADGSPRVGHLSQSRAANPLRRRGPAAAPRRAPLRPVRRLYALDEPTSSASRVPRRHARRATSWWPRGTRWSSSSTTSHGRLRGPPCRSARGRPGRRPDRGRRRPRGSSTSPSSALAGHRPPIRITGATYNLESTGLEIERVLNLVGPRQVVPRLRHPAPRADGQPGGPARGRRGGAALAVDARPRGAPAHAGDVVGLFDLVRKLRRDRRGP